MTKIQCKYTALEQSFNEQHQHVVNTKKELTALKELITTKDAALAAQSAAIAEKDAALATQAAALAAVEIPESGHSTTEHPSEGGLLARCSAEMDDDGDVGGHGAMVAGRTAAGKGPHPEFGPFA